MWRYEYMLSYPRNLYYSYIDVCNIEVATKKSDCNIICASPYSTQQRDDFEL